MHPQSAKQGVDHETKESLMRKAEATGLSNATLYGSGQATNRWVGWPIGRELFDLCFYTLETETLCAGLHHASTTQM